MPISHIQSTRNAHLRAMAGGLLVSVCGLAAIGTLVCFVLVHVSAAMGGNRDFVVYWATGQQLVHHANPYDAAALHDIEHAAGLPAKYSVGYMRNPPWALPLAWPLGLLSLRAATLCASLLLVAAFAASARILIGLYGCRDRMVQALVWLFAPALICLIWGQTSLLVLLGIAIFLRFRGTRPFLAGAALWLCTLKPHLLLPVAVVLLAWIVVTRGYQILAGGAAAFLLSVLVTMWVDPQAWSQYTRMLGYSGVESDPIPSLSVLLRTHIAPNFIALQFVPAAVACVWALVYFWKRRRSWDWLRDANLLLLVSIVATPYAYVNDHVVVLPAIVFAAVRTSSRPLLAVLALASTVLEIAFFANYWSRTPIYWATVLAAPFWLVWYWFASRQLSHRFVITRPAA